jgi:hypothetical protein
VWNSGEQIVSQRKTRVVRTYEQAWPLESAWSCPDREIDPVPLSATGRGAPQPFALPAFLGASFAVLRGYWNALKRGNAAIPFADDFSPAALGRLSETTALVHVIDKPRQFRFELVGAKVSEYHRSELEDFFAGDVSSRAPLDYFVSQCSATVESAAPSFYWYAATGGEYKRLMLPFWGDGRVSAILVAFDLGHGGSDAG